MVEHAYQFAESLQSAVASHSTSPAAEQPSASVPLDATGGSTAVVLPAVFERCAFEYYYAEYVNQFRPVGIIETIIVRDLARHTAAMEAWNEGEGALLRQRALRLPELVASPSDDGDGLKDAALAAAVAALEVHQCEAHAQKRSRGFYRALGVLQELQAQRKSRESGEAAATPPNRFPTEQACELHLRTRFERGNYTCPRCGCRRGHYLASRRSWECAECKRQTGIRAGTVAADSPLPLVAWFQAIQLLLWKPAIGTTELAMHLGITRATTVRNIARRIRTALGEERSSELLAGLDRFIAGHPQELPESGARVEHQPSHSHATPSPSAPAGPSSLETYGSENSEETCRQVAEPESSAPHSL